MMSNKIQIMIIGGLLVLSSISLMQIVKATDAPEIEWEETFGGEGNDGGFFVQQTSDGGFFVGGTTQSLNEPSRVWLIKTDSNGNELWNRKYNWDWGSCRQTDDDGFLIVNGELVRKIDANGNELWNKTLPGLRSTLGEQTNDEGYIVIGGKNDELIKTDANGFTQWNRTYGKFGFLRSYFTQVQQTVDDGYIILGGADDEDHSGYVLLVKTDSMGNLIWNKTFWGDDFYYLLKDVTASLVLQTDGGYVIAGRAKHKISPDCLLFKLDTNGNIEWGKRFGTMDHPEAISSVKQTGDGGFIITGSTTTGVYGDTGYNYELWLIKTDSEGNEEWNKVVGGNKFDMGGDAQQTNDGGYIVTGVKSTYSDYYGEDERDLWLIKLGGVGRGNGVVEGDGDDDKGDGGTPGFELILAVCAVALVLFWKRKSKNL